MCYGNGEAMRRPKDERDEKILELQTSLGKLRENEMRMVGRADKAESERDGYRALAIEGAVMRVGTDFPLRVARACRMSVEDMIEEATEVTECNKCDSSGPLAWVKSEGRYLCESCAATLEGGK